MYIYYNMKIFIICSFIMPILALDFSIDISPIIYENCTSCHREGQIASFLPLENYDKMVSETMANIQGCYATADLRGLFT